MSACPTCKSQHLPPANKVLVFIDGVTYAQLIHSTNRERDLQAAVNFLLAMIERERVKGPTHG